MTREEKDLIKLNGLFFFTVSLAGIFVNLFLFQLGDFKAVAFFGFVTFSLLLFVYSLSGYFLKNHSSKTLIRIGLLLFAIFYGCLLLLGEKSIDFLLPLGIVNGVANGFFWAGNNLNQYIATHEHSRDEYFGKLVFLISIGNTLGPILGGSIIFIFSQYIQNFFGYITIFSIVSFLFFLAFLMTKNLPGHTGSQFSVWHIIHHKRTTSWRIVLSQQFLYGLFDVSFGAIFPILIFLFLKEEFLVGSVNAATTIVFALSNYAAIEVIRKYKSSYILGMFLASLGFFLFGLLPNWIGILSLIFLSNGFMPLLNIPASKGIYDTIDDVSEEWHKKYHFLIERDLALGVARILTYGILLVLFTSDNQTVIAQNWVLIIPVFPLLIGLLQIYKEREV